MHCSMSVMYAVMLTPDVDEDDVRLGQLLALAAGLLVVVAGIWSRYCCQAMFNGVSVVR